MIARRCLALRGPSFTAYVAERSEDLEHIVGARTDGVTVEELRRRSAGTSLTSLDLTDGRDELDFSSLVNEDVVHSDRLAAIAESFAPSARVRRARAALAGGRTLSCDFLNSSASAITRGTLSLPDLVGVGVPLLRALDEEQAQFLADLLTVPLRDGQAELEEPLF